MCLPTVMRTSCLFLILLLSGGMASPSTADVPSLNANLRKLADGPMRLVWTRTDNPDDGYVQDASGQLFVLDTEDGKGERCLLPEKGSYSKPIFTPDGTRIVFTDFVEKAAYMVNFDGTGLQKLASGVAADVWNDPATGVDWLYLREGHRDIQGKIVRYRLDDLKVKEVVWTASASGQPFISYFQLSRDGLTSTDTFPWPQVGMAIMSERSYVPMGKGCWPGMSPDGSGRCFSFLGTHKAIQFYDIPPHSSRVIPLMPDEKWKDRPVYHPRWSNHPSLITVTAPRMTSEAELYLGRFDQSFSKIAQWQRLTFNDVADFFGDAWCAAGIQPGKSESVFSAKSLAKKSRSTSRPGLVFRWENELASNAITDENGDTLRLCRATYEGESRPNAWFGADLRKGALVADAESAALAVQACASHEAFSIAFSAAPTLDQEDSGGVMLALGDQGEFLKLQQHGKAMHLSLADESGIVKTHWLGNMSAGTLEHWVIAYADGLLESYRNGILERSASVRPAVKTWKTSMLRFGNLKDGTLPWSGSLEAIEFFDRPLNAKVVDELHTQEARLWAQRVEIPQVTVEAELVETSQPSDPAKILPYTRGLVEQTWKVRKVISGTLKEKQMLVLHWSVLGSKSLPLPNQKGVTGNLKLEPVESHPELKGEYRDSDVLQPDLPVYLNVE
jgi:hypothetical protein